MPLGRLLKGRRCFGDCFKVFSKFVSTKSSTPQKPSYPADEALVQNATLSAILDFISEGSDKKLRIISINAVIDKCIFQLETQAIISDYINEVRFKKGYEGLKAITYSDLRNNGDNPRVASLFGDVYYQISTTWIEIKDKACGGRDCAEQTLNFFLFIAFSAFIFWFIPVLLLSKLLQIAYPWIIVGYLAYHRLLFSDEIDLFQLVMLAIYIGLQLMVIFLGIHVMRIHWWLWHIEPGCSYTWWSGITNSALKNKMNGWYEQVCWYPQAEKIVLRVMGHDIGSIVMEYCKSFKLSEDASLV